MAHVGNPKKMAASETDGMITSGELVVANMQTTSAPVQSPTKPAAQNLCLTDTPDGSAIHKPVSGSSLPYQPGGIAGGEGSARGGGATNNVQTLNSGDSLKCKRGRPRKYGPDGAMALDLVYAAAMPQPSVRATSPSGTFSPPVPPPSAAAPPPPAVADMQTAPAQSLPKPAAQYRCLTYTPDGSTVHKAISSSSPPYQPGGVAAGEGSAKGSGATNNVQTLNSGDSLKCKRGRPRKYGPDGAMAMDLVYAAAMPQPSVRATPPSGTFSPQVPPPSAATPTPPSAAVPLPGMPSSWPRGRLRESSKKQQETEALGSSDIRTMLHAIIVRTGEDVLAKITSFSPNGPRAVCVLSAIGSISNVTLRQPATYGGMATYEGRFDIVTLSGTFVLSEVGGQRSRSGDLNVTLAGTEGQFLSGCVAGLLIAASPVQVIFGSFVPGGRKESVSENHMGQLSGPLTVNFVGADGASSQPSRGTLSESSGGPGSPVNHISNSQGILNMP